MTRGKKIRDVIQWSKLPNVAEIWDYSAANVAILSRHGVKARHVPLQTPQIYLDKINIWKNIGKSVGFCGSINPRRAYIFNQLQKRGIAVNIIKEFGELRDEKLAKNQIIINIHYDSDYKIFESCRCIPWITAGYTVISENSLDNDSRCINVSYYKLVEEVSKAIEK